MKFYIIEIGECHFCKEKARFIAFKEGWKRTDLFFFDKMSGHWLLCKEHALKFEKAHLEKAGEKWWK